MQPKAVPCWSPTGFRAGDALLVRERARRCRRARRDARGVVAGRRDRARVAELAVKQQARVVERGSGRMVTPQARQDAGAGRAFARRRRHLAAGSGERSIQPRASLRQVAADLPEPPQARGKAQLRARSVRILVRPGQGGAEVVVIVRQAREPRRLLGTREEPGPSRLDDGEVPVAVAGVDRGCLGGLGQALLRVVADRLEHAVPRLGRRRFGRSSDLSMSRSRRSSTPRRTTGRQRRPPRPPPGRTTRRTPRGRGAGALRVGQQVEAPVHGGAKRPMRGSAVRLPPVSRRNRWSRPRGDLGRWERANPGRGELDRQWDAVEAAADLRDRLRVLGRQSEAGVDRAPRSRKRRTASDAESCASSSGVDVVMRPRDFCGVQVLGGPAGTRYCGGYGDIAAARPGGGPAPGAPDPASSRPGRAGARPLQGANSRRERRQNCRLATSGPPRRAAPPPVRPAGSWKSRSLHCPHGRRTALQSLRGQSAWPVCRRRRRQSSPECAVFTAAWVGVKFPAGEPPEPPHPHPHAGDWAIYPNRI